MLDSDQVTFPSFAPSLSESPRQILQGSKHQFNFFPSKKMSISMQHNECQSEEESNN